MVSHSDPPHRDPKQAERLQGRDASRDSMIRGAHQAKIDEGIAEANRGARPEPVGQAGAHDDIALLIPHRTRGRIANFTGDLV